MSLAVSEQHDNALNLGMTLSWVFLGIVPREN